MIIVSRSPLSHPSALSHHSRARVRFSYYTNSMEMRAFGRTGMQVGALGFGAAEIGFENTADHTVDTLLGEALELGFNVIDTAAMYSDSEENNVHPAREAQPSLSFHQVRTTSPTQEQFGRISGTGTSQVATFEKRSG